MWVAKLQRSWKRDRALDGAMLVKIKPTKVIAQKDMMLH